MKKIMFLGDLHGNITATRAMEQEIERIRPEELWFLGDAVGKGPRSDLTCDWVREHCRHFVGGNWDYGLGSRRVPGDEFYWEQLGEERRKWLSELPREAELWISGIHFRIFHGRPYQPILRGYDPDEKLDAPLQDGDIVYTGLICADSHRPYERLTHKGYVLNTGSVGNNLGLPLAHALLIEGEVGETKPAPLRITTVSVPYDNEAEKKLAMETENMINRDSYIQEITTGVYSRSWGEKKK